MSDVTVQNQRVVLAARPSGVPELAHFRVESVPLAEPGPGQMRLKTLYLSLDPYMRLRMNDGPSYAEPVAIGEAMCGGTVCRVEASRHGQFKDGDLVLAGSGWQQYAISDGVGVSRLGASLAQPSWALGLLGMPGFTAYCGLLKIGEPKAGETVVVGAATGAVGAVVGQLAKILGCRVVGVAGGAHKCRHAVEALGFDACIDHRAPDFAAQLAAACPKGIDIYFENVGGAVLEAVLPLFNDHARMPLCGLIAWYDGENIAAGPDRTPLLLRTALVRRIRIQGFIVIDWYERCYGEFVAAMSGWLAEGRLRYTEQVVDGLAAAPQAFLDLLRGDNFGKVVVRVAA